MSRPYKLQWQDRIHEDETLSSTQKLVALAASWYADSEDGGNVFPGVPTLARRTSLSERSVQYALRELKRRGYLFDETPVEVRKRQHRDGLANVYRLIFPARTGASDDGNRCNSRPKGVQQMHPNTHMNTHKSLGSAVAASTSSLTHSKRSLFDPPYDQTAHDPMEWIDEQVGYFGPGEQAMADAMLDRGEHPHFIVNAINKQRETAIF